MEPLVIEGLGVLCACGRGIEKFDRALRAGWVAPQESVDGRLAYRVNAHDLTDREVLKKARRADRFSKMTVLAAHDALVDGGFQVDNIRQTGIIVATAFGAHSSIFRFLDDIIDYGELNVSPTTFAHTLHNAAASYVATVLGSRGPTITITQFEFVFHQALQLAYAWLVEKRVERVLVGVTDECSPAMEYICEEKLALADDGKMKPLSCQEEPKVVPGEGSAFFLLSLDTGRKKYGSIAEISVGLDRPVPDDVDLSLIGSNAMAGSEKVYAKVLQRGVDVAAYSNIYGGLMAGAAFECVASALMLKRQVRYGTSNSGKPKDWRTIDTTIAQDLNAIRCVAHNCTGDAAFIRITK